MVSAIRSYRVGGTPHVGRTAQCPGPGGRMTSSRMIEVLAVLGSDVQDHRAGLSPKAVALAALVLGVDGISASVGTGPEGAVLGWGHETVSITLEDLQFTLGEGPGLEAIAAGVPVLVPDLLDAAKRWPAFASGAAVLGRRAVFAFPLQIGAISVGVLTAYRDTPGPLYAEQLADALALADATTVLLLHRAAPGRGRPQPGWAQPSVSRAEVHQATGMISVQLEVSLAEALVRLRAHAYGNSRPIAEVAADVVARRLRFEDPDR
jgi:hypothetical protein